MSNTAEYRISVPAGREQQAREALAALGIEMMPAVPRDELMAMRETDHGNLFATRGQIPGMLAQVNRHLEEQGLMPTVDPGHAGWSDRQAAAFLEMCLNEFEWEEGRIAHTEVWYQDDREDVTERWEGLPLRDLE